MARRVAGVLAGALLLTGSPLAGQTTLTIGLDPATHYVWRGADVLDGGSPVQPWATLEFGGTGLSLGAWASFATHERTRLIGDAPRSDLDEMDLTLDLTRGVGPLSLSLGTIHYSWFAHGYPDRATTTLEAYVGVGLQAIPLAPSLTAYYDFNLGDGLYLSLTGEQTVTLGRPVDLSFAIGYMDQAWRPEAGVSDVGAGVALPFRAGRLTLAPAVTVSHAPASGALPRSTTVWAALRLELAPTVLLR